MSRARGRLFSGPSGAADAELVALGVGQHGPAGAVLVVVAMGAGSEGNEPLDLCGCRCRSRRACGSWPTWARAPGGTARPAGGCETPCRCWRSTGWPPYPPAGPTPPTRMRPVRRRPGSRSSRAVKRSQQGLLVVVVHEPTSLEPGGLPVISQPTSVRHSAGSAVSPGLTRYSSCRLPAGSTPLTANQPPSAACASSMPS